MLCYVMLCYVMLCYVMLCYVMLCYVMLCYVMLCYVMLCKFKDICSESKISVICIHYNKLHEVRSLIKTINTISLNGQGPQLNPQEMIPEGCHNLSHYKNRLALRSRSINDSLHCSTETM